MNAEILEIMLHVIMQGLIYSLVVMGVYLSSRVLKFDDLTTEGSFGYGGAITAVLISIGMQQLLTIPLAMLGGLLAG
jgi:putative ABC transport system permease protein